MEIITKYFLLDENENRTEEVHAPPSGEDVRFESVRVEITKDGQGNETEIETHSVKQFGLTVQDSSNNKTKITRLAFRNRFTFAEKVAIAEAAKTDAVVEVLQKDQDAATYIDLSRTDTQQGVQLLASKGLITAERAADILSLTVLPDEEFRG